LPGRRNIVISRDANYQSDGIEAVISVEQALSLVEDVEEVMVIGGGAIYAHCMPFATKLYVTHIKADIDGDTQFPAFDTDKDWLKISSELMQANDKNAFDLDFSVYQRKN